VQTAQLQQAESDAHALAQMATQGGMP
jgi:hypothetical protein